MSDLGSLVDKVRSKNAGPFWLTVDIFCGSKTAYDRVQRDLRTESIAALFRIPPDDLRRFDMPDLFVVKFSLPRPAVQGRPDDRDMHGAGWGPLVAGLQMPDPA